MDWIRKGLNKAVNELNTKTKRGLFGNLLTSIFGVNDEVYQDIHTLEKNQQELIRASSHQTKFMSQALSTFNTTEARIYQQLNHFREKLNNGMSAIRQMQHWYSTVDRNRFNIHVLSAYQVASSYMDEVIDYYESLMEIHYNKGNLYKFLTPAHIDEILNSASTKLPSNLEIVSYPVIKTELKSSNHDICLLSYFVITEVTSFMLIKINAIPLKIDNHKYWMLDIPQDILSIDYNTQRYFQVSEDKLRRSILIKKDIYVCSPAIIRNIENSPNCIIDEIYGRSENNSCQIREGKLNYIQWKQLYTSNSWLLIVPQNLRGIRTDITLNKTGIVTISQSCVCYSHKLLLVLLLPFSYIIEKKTVYLLLIVFCTYFL